MNGSDGSPFAGLMILLFSLFLYFVPSFVAAGRKVMPSLAIFALNLLLGWTLVGWVGALVWALGAKTKAQKEEEMVAQARMIAAYNQFEKPRSNDSIQ